MNSIRNKLRTYCSKRTVKQISSDGSIRFERVFSFPSVKYIAIFNRLKVYHAAGISLALPGCGILEMLGSFPESTFLTASYLGLTTGALLSLASVPFKNIIGYLYISEDDKNIKISSVNYWGKRDDRIISADEWIPLLEMSPKNLDSLYLSPQLIDGTKYKLFIKLGNISNSSKMAHVLE